MPYFTSRNVRCYYQTCGQGEPLVLLHGLGSNSGDWENQLPALSRHFRVIAPDLRGFGRSDKPAAGYQIADYVSDLSTLLDHLSIPSAHVFGYSMGGAIAFQFAADMPQKVRSLVVLNSLPSFRLDTLQKRFEAMLRRFVVNVFGLRLMGAIIARRLFPEPGQSTLREKVRQRYMQNDRDAYLAALNALIGWSVEDRIDRIAVPLLMISADQDYTEPEEKQRWAERFSDAHVVVIANSRHGTPYDQPEQLSNAALEFLLQHRTSAPEKT